MSYRSFLLALLVSWFAFDSAVAGKRRAVAPPDPGEWKLVQGISGAQAVACTPDRLLAGTATGLQALEDGIVLPAGLSGNSIRGMTIAPDGAVFAVTASNGVHRSIDGALTWQRLANAPASVNVLIATYDALYAGGCGGLFASSDGGETWVRGDKGLPGCVHALVARGSRLYAGTEKGLFRAVSSAATAWVSVPTVPPVAIRALAVDPLGRLVAATASGVLRSSNGSLWTAVSTPPRGVRAFFVNDAGIFYAGTETDGIFRSDDAGAIWLHVHRSLRDVRGFCATNDGLFVAGNGTVLRAGAEFRLFGLDFGPFTGFQDPNFGARVTEAQVDALLRIIRGNTWWVRTYGTTPDLLRIGALAHTHGLRAALGAWLGPDTAKNEVQVQNLIAAGQAGDADLLIVGSEVLLRSDLTEAELVAQIRRVRQAVPDVPVAYADTYVQWLAHPDVVDAVDIVLVNYYPYWEGIRVDSAIGVVHAWHRDMLEAARGRPVIVSESGWPSSGNTVGDAVPSLQNTNRYFLELVSWARATRTPLFYFEAFNEPWKTRYEGPQGRHWGVWDENGVLKAGMSATLGGATVADNWSRVEPVGGPGNPSLEFTSVPTYGTFDDLRGRVLHVNPYLHKVLVYIYVFGWWVKPYANRPLTTIASDGTWICDVTTGGIDQQATRYAAYLVRSSYQPPILLGAGTIPASVRAASAASAQVTRTPPPPPP